MAAEPIANLYLARLRGRAQKNIERHQDARRAEAALERMMPPECFLQNGEPARLWRERFDRSQR